MENPSLLRGAINIMSCLYVAIVVAAFPAANEAGLLIPPPRANEVLAPPPGAANEMLAPPPGAKFDLSTWNVQLPVGEPGKPKTVTSPSLVGSNGYQDKYFYMDAADGSAMTFFTPDKGVTFVNSNYPRSELREATSSGNPAYWDPRKKDSLLSARLRVATLKTKVVIGQIIIDRALDAGLPASTKPLIELYYLKSGEIRVGIKPDPGGSSQVQTKIGTIPFGKTFNYTISLTGKKSGALPLVVSIDSVKHNFQMPATFSGYGLAFKAGSYNQESNGVSTTTGATVKFYRLSVTHS